MVKLPIREVHIKYVRLYAASHSETHVDDVKVEFAEGTVTSDINPGGLADPQPISNSFFATYYNAVSVDFHPTPRTQWFVVLSLVWEFGVSDREVRRLECGDVVLLEDMDSKGHTSRVIEPGNVMSVGLAND